MKNIIFIAPPAAGKGTQSKLISEEYNIPHISTGDLLRDEIQKQTKLGTEIKSIISKGELVSDDIMLKLLSKRLSNKDCKKGFILDGYPRNINQAKAYENLLLELNIEHGIVIFLDIDKDLALKRTISRIICPNCGMSYNLLVEDLKPLNEGICDKCNGNLKLRSDDNEETFIKRFDTYLKETSELIDYYKNMGVFFPIKIDETKTSLMVFEEIKELLK